MLLVDDDEEDYLITKDLLGRIEGARHDLSWVDDYGSALRASAETEYDIWLVDYRLGPDDGIELVRELIAGGHDQPAIVLTGQGDRDVDVKAANAGAADYLVKGEISPALLERTIRYSIQSAVHLRALRQREEQLRQTQRMEALGQLAGGVAHDFNNLMSAVIGFSELGLKRLDDRDRIQHYFQEIKRAGERAAGLTHQLLAFSRKQVLETRVIDLNTVIAGVEKLLQHLITDDVEVVTLLDESLGPVEADPGQIEQVLMNLAINASDAMPSGGKLTIETANIEISQDSASQFSDIQPGPYVVLAVSDSGTGMDPETVRRAFEPFFTTKEVGKGTGLGLATVFGIVKQSGGDIQVYSEPGHGTTFRVYLPRAESPANSELGATLPNPDERLDGSETILLVDDEELVRAFEREVLTESGYLILEATDVHHAVELARQHAGPIHLLLTDVVMPELSGRQLSDRVSAERPDLRTLFTSGYTSDTIVRHGVLEPGIAYLPKPLSRLALTRKVREVLDRAEPPGPAPS
ncbi:MAG TPA: response regulator [Gaiellaceae bacterium]